MTQPPRSKPAKPTNVALIAAIAVGGALVLCCGGVGVVAAIGGASGSASPTTSASPRALADRDVLPSSPAPSATSASPSAEALAEVGASAPAVASRAPTPANKPASPSVYYPNCTAVRAAGKAPLYQGQPGYRGPLDRDKDGVACEESSSTGQAARPAPAPVRTTKAPAPATRTDPDFGTCAKAKAAGYGPYTRGVDPEYNYYRDADSDGTVCE